MARATYTISRRGWSNTPLERIQRPAENTFSAGACHDSTRRRCAKAKMCLDCKPESVSGWFHLAGILYGMQPQVPPHVRERAEAKLRRLYRKCRRVTISVEG